MLLLSFHVASVGLNLTMANHVFFCDLWWNPALEEQAVARAWRYGQTREVVVYRLLVADSVETRVAELQAEKRRMASAVLPDGGVATELAGPVSFELLEALF